MSTPSILLAPTTPLISTVPSTSSVLVAPTVTLPVISPVTSPIKSVSSDLFITNLSPTSAYVNAAPIVPIVNPAPFASALVDAPLASVMLRSDTTNSEVVLVVTSPSTVKLPVIVVFPATVKSVPTFKVPSMSTVPVAPVTLKVSALRLSWIIKLASAIFTSPPTSSVPKMPAFTPTFKFCSIPTPPSTTNAPVSLSVLAVVERNVTSPPTPKIPSTSAPPLISNAVALVDVTVSGPVACTVLLIVVAPAIVVAPVSACTTKVLAAAVFDIVKSASSPDNDTAPVKESTSNRSLVLMPPSKLDKPVTSISVNVTADARFKLPAIYISPAISTPPATTNAPSRLPVAAVVF